MAGTRYTPEKIIGLLREAHVVRDRGLKARDVCKTIGCRTSGTTA
jgi:hypothetical protein